MQEDRVKTRITGDHLPGRAGRRVACKNRYDVFLYSFEHLKSMRTRACAFNPFQPISNFSRDLITRLAAGESPFE